MSGVDRDELREALANAFISGWSAHDVLFRSERDAHMNDCIEEALTEICGPDLRNSMSPAGVIAEYERRARQNRPDWSKFVEDAEDDPYGIYLEMADTAADLEVQVDGGKEALHQACLEWVRSLRGNPHKEHEA